MLEFEPKTKEPLISGNFQVREAGGSTLPPFDDSIYEEEMTFNVGEVVYIFTSPDEPGIAFFPHGHGTRNLNDNEQDIVEYEEEIYVTSIRTISRVAWDDERNNPIETKLIRIGQNALAQARTIMVTEEKMEEILYTIETSIEPEKIVIGTGILIPVKSIDNTNYIDQDEKEKYSNFRQIRDKYFKLVKEQNKINDFVPTEKESNFEVNKRGKK